MTFNVSLGWGLLILYLLIILIKFSMLELVKYSKTTSHLWNCFFIRGFKTSIKVYCSTTTLIQYGGVINAFHKLSCSIYVYISMVWRVLETDNHCWSLTQTENIHNILRLCQRMKHQSAQIKKPKIFTKIESRLQFLIWKRNCII